MRDRVERIRQFKKLYHRFCVWFYLVVAFFLLLLGFSRNHFITEIRLKIADFSSGCVAFLHHPVKWFGEVKDSVIDYVAVRDKNKVLKQENQKLIYWVNQAKQLTQENEQLRAQLHFVKKEKNPFWTGEIIIDNSSTFSRSVLLRLGKKDGIKRGFSVLYNDSLLGHIENVGETTSQVLLLTDYESRVPVVVGNKYYLGMLEGDNNQLLKLTSLPQGALVNEGDYVSTSGHAGVYPKGLPVGQVVQIIDEDIYVKPFVFQEQTSFVRVVDFHTDGLLEPICIDNKTVKGK